MRNKYKAAFGAVAASPLLLTGLAMAPSANAATAAPAPHIVPHTATNACQASSSNCFELVFAVAANNDDFNPAADTAMSHVAGGGIFARPNANLHDGTQDFGFIFLGHVPTSGPGAYKFTATDNSLFGGDQLVSNQWIPRGDDTANLCVNVGHISHNAYVQTCDQRPGEVFIITSHVPGLPIPPSGYQYLVSVRHAATAIGHQLLTVPDSGFGQINVQNPQNGKRAQMATIVP